MKLVLISDTHGRFQPDLPDGDILIHAGDLSMEGTVIEMWESVKWLGAQKKRFDHIVFVAGNHDFFAEECPKTMRAMAEDKGIIYLQDESTEINGLKFWGSPMTPEFGGWAFMVHRGELMDNHWKRIPDDTDILITHGPPYGILDSTNQGESVGCEALREHVRRVKPALHVFGHIHEGHGKERLFGMPTLFVNASLLDERYVPSGESIIFDTEEKS